MIVLYSADDTAINGDDASSCSPFVCHRICFRIPGPPHLGHKKSPEARHVKQDDSLCSLGKENIFTIPKKTATSKERYFKPFSGFAQAIAEAPLVPVVDLLVCPIPINPVVQPPEGFPYVIVSQSAFLLFRPLLLVNAIEIENYFFLIISTIRFDRERGGLKCCRYQVPNGPTPDVEVLPEVMLDLVIPHLIPGDVERSEPSRREKHLYRGSVPDHETEMA